MKSAVSSAKSITGRRKNNQDAYFVDDDLEVWVVADGMGGYEGGEVASRIAVETIREFFESNAQDGAITWPFPMRSDLGLAENKVDVAVRLAHRSICDHRTGRLAKMGSTIVVVARVEDRAVLGHLGDSRIYRLRDGALDQLTRDHSLYNDLLDAGADGLPAPEDFTHNNVVSRALGCDTSTGASPTLTSIDLEPGDRLLLCSDGLHDSVPHAALADMAAMNPLDDALTKMIDAALVHGSTDNITALLVDFGEAR